MTLHDVVFRRQQPGGFIVIPLVHCYAHNGYVDNNTQILLRQLRVQFDPQTEQNEVRQVTWNIPLDDAGNIPLDAQEKLMQEKVTKYVHSGLNPDILDRDDVMAFVSLCINASNWL